jgi:plastocyanin
MDLTFGPDGAMYVADFHGSIYRVASVQDTPDSVTVEIHAGQFVPQVVAITHDMTVNWVNLDTVAHNVTAERAIIPGDPSEEPVLQPGDEMNSNGDIAPRKSHSHEFEDENGVWQYHSTTSATDDATMRGAVFVAPLDR